MRLQEGKVKKGGVNKAPTLPRPVGSPGAQGKASSRKVPWIYGVLPDGNWFIAELVNNKFYKVQSILAGDDQEGRVRTSCEIYNKRDGI